MCAFDIVRLCRVKICRNFAKMYRGNLLEIVDILWMGAGPGPPLLMYAFRYYDYVRVLFA